MSALTKDGMNDALEWIYENIPRQAKAVEEKSEIEEENQQKPKRSQRA